MAQQEEGWPLGLQPINVRVGLGRNNDFSGSVSFNTLITGSPTSSTDSSSDLDTESTGSFFHDKSITLGSLIGVTSILELSRRSLRGRKAEDNCKEKKNNNGKSRIWFFSLCSRNSTDAEIVNNNNGPSLGHFLAVERKAANECRRNQMSPNIYGPDEFSVPQHVSEPNSLFVDGRVAPPRSSPLCSTEVERRIKDAELEHGIGHGIPLLFSCMCGQHSH
ncbi:hypothetical protein FEM48_Zijuj02G0076700 [Ziziphus jujuba var. spinosa]|uniref:Uncharacterized protein n=1 Tax=Ziziphus jujuba var. spinosa TaxID=714518 RepID=A0A978VUH0_ZIZJJ|nr:hypothetical protein FEM48_Zijuj02G0076700 [Ziziphus jujuba var. spinosa]